MIQTVNGELANTLPIAQRSTQYGDGLFETIAVKEGVPLLWDLHLNRLDRGILALGLNVDKPALETECEQILVKAKQQRLNGVLKVTLARDFTQDIPRGYCPDPNATVTRIVQFSTLSDAALNNQNRSARLMVSPQRLACAPSLVGLKTLNALPYVLASRCLYGSSADEALILDEQGYVIEGTKTNVFWVNDSGVLCTSRLDKAGVAGVMRECIIQAVNHLSRIKGVEIIKAPLESLVKARELFITNSLLGVLPVSHINDIEFAVGKVTRQVQQITQEFTLC